MKKISFCILTMMLFFTSFVFAESKEETFVSKIPALPPTWAAAVKLRTQCSNMIVDMEKDLKALAKDLGMVEPDKEMTDAEKAQYVQTMMAKQQSTKDIMNPQEMAMMQEVMASVQDSMSAELNQNIQERKNKFDALLSQISDDMLVLDKKYPSVRGPGVTEPNPKDVKAYKSDLAKLKETEYGKIKAFLESYLPGISDIAAKHGPVAEKALTTAKSFQVKIQAFNLRQGIMRIITDFVNHYVVALREEKTER